MVPLPFWQSPAGSSIKAKRALILTVYFGLLMLKFSPRLSRGRYRRVASASTGGGPSPVLAGSGGYGYGRKHVAIAAVASPSTPMSAGATTLHALLQMMTVAPDPQMGQRGFNL
ncbi:hypothetical protein DMB90_11275 [Raoultella planticola]|uniref:Uncharacterized protein n=1 Tax=Raoultella planticola TaxID=575 RepID=A0A5P6A9U9_RAOPL|nr:hypothetical protein DMB90_11275 [Raoultella planticola]